ncbi:MAG TPA: hypothetical protein ENN25_00580 [Euryarchaeota archaeon]|nr:hypothetical protein [Euryarchaeota archaeon]
MLVKLMLIVSGLVLLSGVLYVIPAIGKRLEKLSKFLGGFQTIIGIIAIIIGVLNITELSGIVLLIVGLIMAIGILPAIPAIGKKIEKVAKFMAGYQIPIGIIALVLGIIWLL